MLHIICNALKAKIETLPFKDKVSGLVRVAIKNIESTLDDGQVYKITETRFPVAANVTGAQCQNISQYKDLTPDIKNKSVVYFEQLSAENTGESQANILEENAQIRLVCWLNLKALGIDLSNSDEQIAIIKYHLADILRGKQLITLGGVTVKALLTPFRIVDDASIFTKYTYNKNIIEHMLLYPYSYFAIDFNVVWYRGKGCFQNTVLTPIAC